METRRRATDAWFSNNQDMSNRCVNLRKRFETPSVPTFYIYRRWNESSGAKAYASESSPSHDDVEHYFRYAEGI